MGDVAALEPALLAYRESVMAARDDDDDIYVLLLVLHPDGRIEPFAGADRPTWPHVCGADRCAACAPHLFVAPPPDLGGSVGDGLPWAIIERDEATLVDGPRGPRGWEIEREPSGVGVLRLVELNRAATWPALIALASAEVGAGRSVHLGRSDAFTPDRPHHAAFDAAIRAATGDVRGPGAVIRDAHLARFVHTARAELAKHPRLDTILLYVAQFYSDNASDEIHVWTYGSVNAAPQWPHVCVRGEMRDPLPDDVCGWCVRGFANDLVLDYRAAPVGFEMYCAEGAHQEMESGEQYRPYAVVRRRGDAIDVEIVGVSLRPHHVIGLVGDGLGERPWPDARAAGLVGDREARAVLADHLIEQGDPRGERLASGTIAMLDPIGRAIAVGGARFEGGFLVGAEVFCATPELADELRGAPAWTTVESLRYLRGSAGTLLDPTMRTSLRELANPTREDLAVIAATDEPWAIETLQVAGDDGSQWALHAHRLPRLRYVMLDHETTVVFPHHIRVAIDADLDELGRPKRGSLAALAGATLADTP